MESPCNRVCVMDGDKRYCLGCWRTLAEITHWGGMNDAEQAAVLRKIERRRAEARRRHASRTSAWSLD